MESLIFSIEAVLPIILMIALGYFIKRMGLVKIEHAKLLNKLVFRLFLPVMLFLNVYNIKSLEKFQYGYVIYAVIAVALIFLLSLPFIILVTKRSERRGALLQSTFRSNYALIGIPLAESLFGTAGVTVATLLSAIIVPFFNILAVIGLSIFRRDRQRPSVKKILLDIIKNPLIVSIFIGVVMLFIRSVFVKFGIEFRLTDITPLSKVLSYLSSVATPLALLVLGIQFEFSAISSFKREIVFGVLVRTVIVPILGVGIAFLFFKQHFSGAHFAAFVSVFATPVAVSSVPMAQEMGSDSELAGQLVIWTTLTSAFTVFIASFLLKYVGIF